MDSLRQRKSQRLLKAAAKNPAATSNIAPRGLNTKQEAQDEVPIAQAKGSTGKHVSDSLHTNAEGSEERQSPPN